MGVVKVRCEVAARAGDASGRTHWQAFPALHPRCAGASGRLQRVYGSYGWRARMSGTVTKSYAFRTRCQKAGCLRLEAPGEPA
jgi:hypothetical protein